MEKNSTDLLSEVSEYYSVKLARHGKTPRGVDWNGIESQTLRFEQLSKIICIVNSFSINDLGCGYGAYYDFLKTNHCSFTYCGIDVSHDMIGAAKGRCQDNSEARFVVSSEPDQVADHGVASGIFNVRLSRSDDEWWTYLPPRRSASHQPTRFRLHLSDLLFRCR